MWFQQECKDSRLDAVYHLRVTSLSDFDSLMQAPFWPCIIRLLTLQRLMSSSCFGHSSQQGHKFAALFVPRIWCAFRSLLAHLFLVKLLSWQSFQCSPTSELMQMVQAYSLLGHRRLRWLYAAMCCWMRIDALCFQWQMVTRTNG